MKEGDGEEEEGEGMGGRAVWLLRLTGLEGTDGFGRGKVFRKPLLLPLLLKAC